VFLADERKLETRMFEEVPQAAKRAYQEGHPDEDDESFVFSNAVGMPIYALRNQRAAYWACKNISQASLEFEDTVYK